MKTEAYDATCEILCEYSSAFQKTKESRSMPINNERTVVSPQHQLYLHGMPATDQLNFIKPSLGQAFQSAGVSQEDHCLRSQKRGVTGLCDSPC